MRTKNVWGGILTVLLLLGLSACSDPAETPTMFSVTIENVAATVGATGGFNTPVGAGAAGAATPGNAYEFSFTAVAGDRVSFATMFVGSNDLFFGPSDTGLPLFGSSGTPITGDVTASIMLWDAGTEVNEAPGTGMNQPPAVGGTAENGTVRLVSTVGDGFTYPAVSDVVTVTLTESAGTFTLRIEVSATSPTPIAPGVFVVHNAGNPLFTNGVADYGQGLEELAEDGNAVTLAASLPDLATAFSTPIAPGVWAVHSEINPLFTSRSMDGGHGLESLAEDGDPSMLASYLTTQANILSSGSFDTPVGATMAGVAGPGKSYAFMVEALSGEKLSFATMFVQSNDLFFAPGGAGISLFDTGGTPVSGEMTTSVDLWDAGTEVNEVPGAGVNQAPRQTGANTGTAEGGMVQTISAAADGFVYPSVGDAIRVTITPQ